MDHDDRASQPIESSPECPVEHLSAAIQSLDTVRALHQTVVSLRAALEDAHREIEHLKKHISINVDIDNGKVFRQSADNLNTLDTDTATANKPATVKLDKRFVRDCGVYKLHPRSTSDADRRRPMASKIDVKIKVSSNIKLNEVGSSTSEEATTTDNNSGKLVSKLWF